MSSVNQDLKFPIQTWKEPEDQGYTVLNAIGTAKYSIDISIYELGGPHILAALLAAKAKGVFIRIMYNGQFFTKNTPGNDKFAQQYAIAKALAVAPGNNQSEVNWACNNFNITHQKTIIIDARIGVVPKTLPTSAKALVMTLNLSAYEWLPDSKSIPNYQFWGTDYPYPGKGTRDFGVLLTSPVHIEKISSVYESDFNCAASNDTNNLKDSVDGLVWSNGTTGILPAQEGFYPADGAYPPYDYKTMKTDGAVDEGNARATHLKVINKAKKSLIIYNEEMNDTELVDAIVQAAKNGVSVKVLMSNTYAENFNLLINAGAEIRLFPNNSNYMYIHAKVLLADYGETDALSFVGSQNISGNSLNFNRELGVMISGSKDNEIFNDTFYSDWSTPGLQTWKQTKEILKDDDYGNSTHKYYPSANDKITFYPPMKCGPLN